MRYFEKVGIAITITDRDGKILEMNESSCRVNLSPGQSIIGSNVLDCHPEKARLLLEQLMRDEETHAYTIQKGDVKKLIYQMPWYDEAGEYAGFIELSLPLPAEMPHYVRQPK